MRQPQQVTTGREMGIIQTTAYNDIHHLFIPVYLHLPSIISSISYGNLEEIHRNSQTEIYMPHLSIGRNLQWPKRNHELHENIMMMSDSDLTGDLSIS